MTPETLDAMVKAGATVEVIAAAWKAEMATRERELAEKRAKDAERQRRHRESRLVTVTPRESANDPAPLNPPLKGSPHPSKITPPISPHPVGRASRLPNDFVAPGEWIEWAMAKRKWTRDDAREEAECFCRFWQAKAGKDAAKLDWFKTWQNWVSSSRRQSTAAPPVWDGLA